MSSSNDPSSTPLLRSKKNSSHNLQSSKPQFFSDHISLTSTTPEKPAPRLHNRGVALSVVEIRKVAKGLQDQSLTQKHSDLDWVKGKSVKRKILTPSPLKSKTTVDGPFTIPEKYEILCEFFHSLDSSIRLTQMKGRMPSFTNIAQKIESLSDRRFTHSHLAQLQFILPEGILIKKVLVFDERTSSMKPDLHVTINRNEILSAATMLPKCESLCESMQMRLLFRIQLAEFFKSHPEGSEIPEAELPEPFNRPKQDCFSDVLKTPSSIHPPKILSSRMLDNDVVDYTESANREERLSVPINSPIEALNQKPAVASHMPQSFRRSFLQKSMENGADSIQKILPSDSFQTLAHPVSESNLNKNSTSLVKFVSEAADSEICPTIYASSGYFESSSAPCAATPSKIIDYTSTPVKHVFTPSRLMVATPEIPPSKKHYLSPDDNSSSSMSKLVRRPPRSRLLKFDSPMENKETRDEDDAGRLSINDDIFDILPKNLLESIREKERVTMEERDPVISQAKRRQKMVDSLPKLFNMIHLLFHSMKCSLIAKEELVSKIISSHRDIVDRREIEEQLDLLLVLVPEWISEKLTSGGNILFSINKKLNPGTIRASLEEAK
ncbi:hypothetical protein TanjilG_01198 [Lupinus angustifolius]|uniref:CDT1 Geminin-binding domain-containing protein n=1 Tax=Lupinus angustifolius TaxID=3871 RepID=A0A1J7HMQ7_LUPAN|nr:PREDICTED: CDT1-like protein a, chloroplastic [Lupinus angustifolius]XP_019459717.1 PREDICTED: CDT1-like protein a, chloroplastic [Lupinus angustifolius]OIW01691.1 hypothetical protein TanjilG_01198 [Lupinus angustifolius]